MAEKTKPKARKAEQGKKMIEVRLRFWTNDIAGKGKFYPKHGLTAGMVRIEANDIHGIVPKQPRPFHSLLDVGKAVEQVLLDHGITLHINSSMKRYVSTK